MYLNSVAPIVEGQELFGLSDGLHGAPMAWRASGHNLGGASGSTLAVVVVCAPIGG